MSEVYIKDEARQILVSGELPDHLPDAAIFYAEHGIPVFPCHGIRSDGRCTCGKPGCERSGKHPHYHREDLTNGHNNATTDPEQVRRWWKRWPDANIGIPTGKASGIVAVDVDKDSEKGRDGYASLKAIEDEHGWIPPSIAVRTGSGLGKHFFYQYAKPMPTRKDMRPGIDFRGDGGYVIAPPSAGSVYRYQFIFDFGLAPLPDYLAEMVRERPEDCLQAPARDVRGYGYPGTDAELVEAARHNQKTGAMFARLYDSGNWSGFASRSEADHYLAARLAFWCGPHPERIERIMRESAMHRAKWNTHRTYLSRTIDHAIRMARSFYDPEYRERKQREVREIVGAISEVVGNWPDATYRERLIAVVGFAINGHLQDDGDILFNVSNRQVAKLELPGFSQPQVSRFMNRLEKDGYIERLPYTGKDKRARRSLTYRLMVNHLLVQRGDSRLRDESPVGASVDSLRESPVRTHGGGKRKKLYSAEPRRKPPSKRIGLSPRS